MSNIDFTHKTIENQTAGISVSKTTFQSLFDAVRKIVDKSYRGSTEKLDADLLAGVVPGAGGLAALAKTATIWASDNDGNGGQAPAPKGTVVSTSIATATWSDIFALPAKRGAYLVQVSLPDSINYPYSAIALITVSSGGTAVRLVALSNDAGLEIQLSGRYVQIRQNTGDTNYIVASLANLGGT